MNNKILIHCCCAHCAAYTIRHFKRLNYEVAAYWYNPNIHPYTEHNSRFDSMRKLAAEEEITLIVEQGYDMPNFINMVAGDINNRCRQCFKMRLGKCAEIARKKGFKEFTSTLLISPHQKHQLIKEIGAEVACESGVNFNYEDLRKSYSQSRSITKPMGFYRQQYCGCIYSEWERFRGED